MANAVNTNLWSSYNGKGFAAEYAGYSERANKDANGNEIDRTYATTANMAITDVSGDSTKKNIQLKSGLSQDVLVAHQDLSGKANVATSLAGYGIVDAYTKTETDTLLGDKVDTVTGKGLSTNDYTDADVSIVHKVWTSSVYTRPATDYITIGGKSYHIAQINNRIWMTENLDLNDYGAVDSANPDYGKLYPMSALGSIPIPAGWRIPKETDGIDLCGDNGSLAVGYRVSTWDSGTNTTGFSAVPSGYIDNGNLYSNYNVIFTATQTGGMLYYIQIGVNSARVYHGDAALNYKMSIRLVKDA